MQTSPKILWVQDLHDVRLGPENRATLGGHHDKHVASGHETAGLKRSSAWHAASSHAPEVSSAQALDASSKQLRALPMNLPGRCMSGHK